LRCGTSKPPVPEQRLINHLHAEKMKRRKDAMEAKADRKRKRKAKHDKECKLARAEGKAQPATPESSEEEEEEASDAEVHALRSDGESTGASPPPFYLWDDDEGEPVAPEVTRVVAEPSSGPSLDGAEREPSPLATGEETPAPQVLIRGDEAAAGEESSVLLASRHRADTRGAPSGQSSRGGTMPRARRSATRKRSMSARSG
jgi:hypothetical protein